MGCGSVSQTPRTAAAAVDYVVLPQLRAVYGRGGKNQSTEYIRSMKKTRVRKRELPGIPGMQEAKGCTLSLLGPPPSPIVGTTRQLSHPKHPECRQQRTCKSCTSSADTEPPKDEFTDWARLGIAFLDIFFEQYPGNDARGAAAAPTRPWLRHRNDAAPAMRRADTTEGAMVSSLCCRLEPSNLRPSAT